MNDSLPSVWHDVPSGEKRRIALPVTQRADGGEVNLPVLVARGSRPGRVLLATAGVHGDEFEGMAALWEVFEALDPGALQGTFVAVPVVNGPAYEAGLRTNPDDRQDLARIFPGDPRGTVSEQIAWRLTHAAIRHADFYCDLHSAGNYFAIEPWTGYQLRPDAIEQQRQASRVFGLPLAWGTPGLPGRSLSAAFEFGVPAMYAELRGEGRCRPQDVARYVFGIRQLLAWMEITPDAVQPTPAPRVVEDERPNAGFLQVQNRAPMGGFFHALIEVGAQVQAGQLVGTIRDSLGQAKSEVRAGASGQVIFLRTFSRVLAGEPLLNVMED